MPNKDNYNVRPDLIVEIKDNPLEVQVGGDHYKKLKIQPVEYIQENQIGYMEGNVIKYVTRWKDKNGIADLQKAKHYLDMLIQFHETNTKTNR